jgi:hypothetical protein
MTAPRFCRYCLRNEVQPDNYCRKCGGWSEPRSAAGSRASSLLELPGASASGAFSPRSGGVRARVCVVGSAHRLRDHAHHPRAAARRTATSWPGINRPALTESSPGGNTSLPCGIKPAGNAGCGIRVLMLTNGIRATCQPGDETPRHLPSAQRLTIPPVPAVLPRSTVSGAAPRVETSAKADPRRRAGLGSRTSAGGNPRGPAACQPTAGPMTVTLEPFAMVAERGHAPRDTTTGKVSCFRASNPARWGAPVRQHQLPPATRRGAFLGVSA